MKIFYVKKCNWRFGELSFENYWDAVNYVDGYNDALGYKDRYSSYQKEYVKVFAYEYDSVSSILNISQVVWRYQGPSQKQTYWTHALRKSHLNTVKTRLEKRPISVSLSKKHWEESLTTGRERLVQNMFYQYWFEVNQKIADLREDDSDDSDDEDEGEEGGNDEGENEEGGNERGVESTVGVNV